jgi:hypothetical protein
MSTNLFDFIGPAIKAIDINIKFEIIDNDVNQINWLNGNPNNITNEQILAKAQELKNIADYRAQYWPGRKKDFDFLPIVDQLDNLFHDIENNKLDTSGEFYKSIKTIKDKYPKP